MLKCPLKENQLCIALRVHNLKLCSCVSEIVFYLQLLGEVVGDYGGEGREQGSQEDTDVTDVNGDVEKM